MDSPPPVIEYRHDTSLGQVWLAAHYDKHGAALSVDVLRADPQVLIGGHLLREIAAGGEMMRTPLAKVDYPGVGGKLTIAASGGTLTYMITSAGCTIGDVSVPDVFVGTLVARRKDNPMRRRDMYVADLKTGHETRSFEVLPDATFPDRMNGLLASLPPHVDVDRSLVALACDGCDRIVSLDSADPHLPDGWTSDDRGDLCGECT